MLPARKDVLSKLPVNFTGYPGEIVRDGIHLQFYPDGSGPTLRVVHGGAQYSGVNERLNAKYRRHPEQRTWKPGTPVPKPTKESLLINPAATTLDFKRDTVFCNLPFFRIDGDMGRAFPPQPWARGLLPIVPLGRVFAFAEGGNRALLEYTPPKHVDEHLIGTAAELLLTGWDHGFLRGVDTTQSMLRVLEAMGLGCTPSVLRRALEGRAEMYGAQDWERKLHYRWKPVAPKTRVFDAGAAATCARLAALYAAFEPYTIVKSADVHYDSLWWSRVKLQGCKNDGITRGSV